MRILIYNAKRVIHGKVWASKLPPILRIMQDIILRDEGDFYYVVRSRYSFLVKRGSVIAKERVGDLFAVNSLALILQERGSRSFRVPLGKLDKTPFVDYLFRAMNEVGWDQADRSVLVAWKREERKRQAEAEEAIDSMLQP